MKKFEEYTKSEKEAIVNKGGDAKTKLEKAYLEWREENRSAFTERQFNILVNSDPECYMTCDGLEDVKELINETICAGEFDELTEEEKAACEKACDICGLLTNRYSAGERYADGSLTINKGRDGKEYAWLMWSETIEAAVRVGDLYELSAKEINELLAD